jgi:chromosome segregation ATPase
MAARKSHAPARKAAPAAARRKRVGRIVSALAVEDKLRSHTARIDQLAAALEAEHKLAGEAATAKAKLEEEFEAYKRDAKAASDLLDDGRQAQIETRDRALAEANESRARLAEDILAKAAEIDRLKAQLAAAIERNPDADALRRELREAKGEAAFHRLRDERHLAAVTALALRLGDVEAELLERQDDDAIASGRHEVPHV